VALHACGLGVHGDGWLGHLRHGSSTKGRKDWQLVGYCTSLLIQRPTGPQHSRRPGPRSRGREPTSPDLWAPAEPPNRGGLPVLETLHLVADIAKGYQMF